MFGKMEIQDLIKWIRIPLLALLVIYSFVLVSINIRGGEDNVRVYFSDIVPNMEYSLRFETLFGINTTLTMLLLAGSALLFMVCLGSGNHENKSLKPHLFQLSQAGIFAYLAADDRLRIHEAIGARLGVEDAFVLLGIGIVEVSFLLILGEIIKRPWRLKGCLLVSSAFFGLMVLVDVTQYIGFPGRLVIEDLSKLWAIVFIFVYSWRYCMGWLSEEA